MVNDSTWWNTIQHNSETYISVKDVVRPLSRAKIIPGTRPFNQFIPLSRRKIATKRVSKDIDYSVKFEFEQIQQVLGLLIVTIGQFVLCTYEGHKLVGMACEVNTAFKVTEIKFMYSLCPSRSYTWLRCDHICWVPVTNIFFSLKTQSMTAGIGRQYYLHNDDQKYI